MDRPVGEPSDTARRWSPLSDSLSACERALLAHAGGAPLAGGLWLSLTAGDLRTARDHVAATHSLEDSPAAPDRGAGSGHRRPGGDPIADLIAAASADVDVLLDASRDPADRAFLAGLAARLFALRAHVIEEAR